MKLQESVYFILNKLKESGTDKLSIDENGYLKITDMYYKTPEENGYITDQYGNFIHSSNNTDDSWCIYSNNGIPKLEVTYEGNVCNRLGAGLEVIHSLIDAKQSNNGVSQNTANTTLALRDKNELITNTVRSAFGTDGSIRTQLQARNYNSSGTLVKTGSLGVVVAKDGTLSYEVTEPDKFRKAIGLGDSVEIQDLAVNSSLFRLYSSNDFIKLVRWGRVCFLSGTVQPINSLDSSSTRLICNIPTGYTPKYPIRTRMQGSGTATWLFEVSPTQVLCSRYFESNATGFQNIPNTAWLPFYATWIC